MVTIIGHPLDFSVPVIFPGHQENARIVQEQEIIISVIYLQKIFLAVNKRTHVVLVIQVPITIFRLPEISHIQLPSGLFESTARIISSENPMRA